jgi:hypothetical protein
MNKPFTLPVAYEDDVYGWAMRQAALLRAGRMSEIDVVNVAEEIESVGISEYHRLVSAVRVLFIHMLKWDYQPERRSRSWTLTIIEQRERLERSLSRNPSLKGSLDEAFVHAYREAKPAAARETDLPLKVFPPECPFDWHAITERPYPLDE